MTTNEIIADAQRSVGDVGGQIIQRSEYVRFLQLVVNEAARTWKLWITAQLFRPVPTAIVTFNLDTDRTAYTPVVGDIGAMFLVNETQQYWTVRPELTWHPTSSNTLWIWGTGANAQPIIKITRVEREGYPAFELSRGSAITGTLGRQGGYPSPFPRTNATLSIGYEFGTHKYPNGDMELTFTRPFDVGEGVVIEYMQEIPFQVAKVNDTFQIPSFADQAILAGLKWRCFEAMFAMGNDAAMRRMDVYLNQFKQEMKIVKAYTKAFKDERSVPQNQPFIWLSEE